MRARWRGWAGHAATAGLAMLALIIVAYGLLAIGRYGLTEMYADQWRQYMPYLQLGFPANVLAVENGHRTVLPSLIRLVENATMEGNQRLQLAAGAGFALTAWLVLAWIGLRERGLSLQSRWLVLALAAMALFWLGNARMLLHGTEAIQLYLIVACQVGAAALVARPLAGRAALATACLLCLVATFSFGPGLAVFPAAAIVLGLQRRWRDAGLVVMATALTLALYLSLPGGDGVRGALVIQPLANLHVAATWLSSMWVNLLQPLIEVDAGRTLPLGLYETTRPLARLYGAAFGDPWVDHGPFALLGWLGLAGLVWLSWRASRRRPVGRLALVGLGCAWFALGVAGIVALGRMDYFAAHPSQIFANRYVPWSCVFWFGLIAAAVGLRARPFVAVDGDGAVAPVPGGGFGADVAVSHAGGASPGDHAIQRPAAASAAVGADRLGRAPRWTWLPAGLMLVMAVLTTPSHRLWSTIVQQGVRLDSAGFVSGVIDPQRSLGETIVDEVITGLPRIRDAGLSAFAWPESRRLGTPAATAAKAEGLDVIELTATSVGNRLGPGATRLQIAVRRTADVALPARLLIEVDGRLAGVMVRQTLLPGWTWVGFVPLPVGPAQVRIHALAPDGSLNCWTGCADRP